MEIRQIQPEDFSEALHLNAVSYNQTSDLAITASTSEDLKNAFGLFENGRLCSAMISHEQRIFFEGSTMPVAGIGNVATYPEHRRKGYVRKLFNYLFPRMREQGQVFSMLFPFSYPYYRAFGYELGYSKNQYTLPLSQLKPNTTQGSLELVVPSGGHIRELDEIKSVYRHFASPRNLALDRGDAGWKNLVSSEPHKNREY